MIFSKCSREHVKHIFKQNKTNFPIWKVVKSQMNLLKTHEESGHLYLYLYSKENVKWEREGLYAK